MAFAAASPRAISVTADLDPKLDIHRLAFRICNASRLDVVFMKTLEVPNC